jgi:iron(II)-dependent oxidoreductase
MDQQSIVPARRTEPAGRALRDARHYTLALFDTLADAGYADAARVPRLPIINPPLWELGHTAWFAEWFVLRAPPAAGRATPTATACWRAATTGSTRTWWRTARAGRSTCRAGRDPDLLRTKCWSGSWSAWPPSRMTTPRSIPIAWRWRTRTCTARPCCTPCRRCRAAAAAPAGPMAPATHAGAAAGGEIAFPGGAFTRGGDQSRGFVFDNEKAAAPRRVAPFAIDAGWCRTPATWPSSRMAATGTRATGARPGRAWLAARNSSAPRYWRRGDGRRWQQLRFGRREALVPDAPVRHLTLHEAQAWCRWAGGACRRKLEWEFAAASGHPDFAWGRLWEWTATPFLPYAGFAADRYLEYSAPWFGTPPDLARRLVRHAGALPQPALQEFLHAGARRHLRRLPQLRALSGKRVPAEAGKKKAAEAAFPRLPKQPYSCDNERLTVAVGTTGAVGRTRVRTAVAAGLRAEAHVARAVRSRRWPSRLRALAG